jgi:hypothetical protein
MASTITITLDAQGTAQIGQLPPGAFYSRFATPPDATVRDVISINAADSYTIVVNGPNISAAVASPPVTVLSSTPVQATFFLDVSVLPLAQGFGMAICQTGGTSGYSLGVIVNPTSLSLPLVIDPSGISVNPTDVPVGLHVDPTRQKLAVWAGGGYTFAFALPAGTNLRFESVEIDPPSPMLIPSIGADKLMAWIYNDNLDVHSGFQTDVKFHCSQLLLLGDQLPEVVLDPTIINNPINQGGGNDSLPAEAPGIELVGALVH